jgi:hypothetical protein
MAARIPIFVSAPTALSPDQAITYDQVCAMIENEGFERRALGRSDYPTEFPLKEVRLIARNCYGGVILGFTQIFANIATLKPGTPDEKPVTDVRFPTPWNQIEAGILFGLKLPLMVFREDGITGGVFDSGVTDVFLQRLPVGGFLPAASEAVRESIRNWSSDVRHLYRSQ